MEDKRIIKDLLTTEEKLVFLESKVRLLQAELHHDLSGHEYKRLYRQASNILLAAVDRELERRGLA
ncbi:hypothetical protein [Neobacillus sp. PS3-40]|uniref:hypothetical protein n=1 Tax=Neobacillus sp. PS3-40 TaxID=3070679 RepID=UPI0027E0DA17|nr:hypothetical protein [Neobacillus sp. PS3-40]WML43122.1 hypothetical protein RCG20_15105 [Neobacillus sp. PS3-40]